jgi:hypothetical protein
MRFFDPPRANAALPGDLVLNRYSGKWNIHFSGAVSSEEAIRYLSRQLSKVGVR